MKTTSPLLLAIVLITVGCSVGEAAQVTGRVRVLDRSRNFQGPTIVWAEPLGGAAIQPGRFSVSQRNKAFSPTVLAVPAGSTVNFPNDDRIFHNVFSLATTGPFDLGLYRAGDSRSNVFRTPGVYRVFCNIHEQMKSVVVVAPSNYFTQVDASGNFRLEVPAGRYRVVAWSERSVPASVEVTVGNLPVATPDFMLDESRYMEIAHKNKYGQDYSLIAYDPIRDRKLGR